MNNYRFTLDSSRPTTLFTCPNCDKPELKRYVDTESGDYLPEHVGRCNREVNCGYHYTPRQFFSEPGQDRNRDLRPTLTRRRSFADSRHTKRTIEPDPLPPSVIPFDLFKRSLEHTEARQANNLLRYLSGLFHTSITATVTARYFIGSSKHWNGATAFWQVDRTGNIRAGKVMLYTPQTGKRNRECKPTWVHTLVQLPGYRLQQCFFGEHLLRNAKVDSTPVAIVESEKTAIIASIYLPEYVWLATGGKQNLTPERFQVLSGSRVILYPDLGCFDEWNAKATEIQRKADCRIAVSNLLEQNATAEDRSKGLDIADYLIRTDPNFGWALTEEGYPLFWDEADQVRHCSAPKKTETA